MVVAKIVKSDSAQITDITTFTNSQNSVRAQDFIALRSDFKSWADAMADRYSIFLEIQRGGWDSQKAYQKSHPNSRQFSEFTNAFDLMKVYGAGWLCEPGQTFQSNTRFVPGGSIFKRITSEDVGFGVDDLYAAYRLKILADKQKFGRGADEPSRRLTRFLFYYVAIDFLRDTLIRAHRQYSCREITKALLILFQGENEEALQGLLDSALEVIAEYLNRESDDSVYKEPTFQGDLTNFLKLEQLGKNDDSTPLFRSLLSDYKRLFGHRSGSHVAPRELVIQAIQ